MNNSVQAKNGFKTFLLTLSLSLVLFSVIYFFANESSSKVDLNIETTNAEEVAGTSVSQVLDDDNNSSAFSSLVAQKIDVPARTVLAGSETSESTTPVPNTGSVEITYAILLSSVLLGFATFVYLNGPRKSAIASFEKDVLKSLD